MLLGCVFAAGNANAARFLYTGGHAVDPVRTAALGDSFTEFYPNDSGWSTALRGGYGSFDAVVVGEKSRDMEISPATRSAIAAYVNGGGKVIIVGNHYGSTSFLNFVFGYSAVASYGCTDNQSVGGAKTAAAVGTNFGSGPPQLHNLSCTGALVSSTLPAAVKTMYAGSGTSLVFTAAYGRGQIGYLGWDLCGGNEECGNNFAYEDDWYIVLHDALLPSFTSCAALGYVGSELILCQTICEQPQSSFTVAGLLQIFKAAYGTTPSCPAAQ
jgi:hypothetical protein